MEGGEVECQTKIETYFNGKTLVSEDMLQLPHPEFTDHLDIRKLVSRKVKARSDPAYRERERMKNLERTRKLRENPEFRERERVRNRISKQRARMDPLYREAERTRNRLQKRKAREDPNYREAERVRNKWQKRRARENPEYRFRERIKDMERKRWKRLCSSGNQYRFDDDDEWMEMGEVALDEAAQVAFDQGLYRLVPPWPSHSLIGSHPWGYLDQDAVSTYCSSSRTTFEEWVTIGGTGSNDIPDWMACHHKSVSPPDREIQTRSVSSKPRYSLRNMGSFDVPKQESDQTVRQDIVGDGPNMYQEFAQSGNELCEQPSLQRDCKLKFNHFNGIEILPLRQQRSNPPPCPNLNWQIELIPVFKNGGDAREDNSSASEKKNVDTSLLSSVIEV